MRDVSEQLRSKGRKLNVTDFSDEGPDMAVKFVQVDAESQDQQEQSGAWDVESLSQLRCIHEMAPEGLIEQADADDLLVGLE